MPELKTGELRRELGVWGSTSIVVGSVIGSGIFLVPATMIQRVGSPELVFLVWIFGGLLTLAGTLSYGELASAMPEAGGEYVYLREAYGRLWGFIYGWMITWVGKSGSIATLATGFAYYLANFFPKLDEVLFTVPLPIGPGGGPLPIIYGQLVAMGLILLLAGVNYHGVKLGGGVQVAFTVSKVVLIASLIVIGLFFGSGTAANLRSSIPAAGGITGFFAALVAALWAYDGWNNVAMVGAEIKNPRRNLPRALIHGMGLVMGIYLLTNLAYFYVLPSSEVAASDRVAATMMGRIAGEGGAAAVSIAAMISIFGALNGTILTGARVPYAVARDGLFLRRLAHVHPVHGTPSTSILLMGGWAAVLVLSGRFEQLFTAVIFAEWLLYGMCTAAVLVLRRKRPDLERFYYTPGYPWVPVVFVVVAAFLLVSTLLESPRESLIGLGLILVGLPFYFRSKDRGSV